MTSDPIQTLIDGYKAFSVMLNEPGHRVAALLTAQEAQDELYRMRRVINGQAETIKQLEKERKATK